MLSNIIEEAQRGPAIGSYVRSRIVTFTGSEEIAKMQINDFATQVEIEGYWFGAARDGHTVLMAPSSADLAAAQDLDDPLTLTQETTAPDLPQAIVVNGLDSITEGFRRWPSA